MTKECDRLKRRRSWTPERLKADQARRARTRAPKIAYVPCPLKPADTVFMVHEEAAIISNLREGQGWIKLWTLLNVMATGVHERARRPKRQALLALITRMISEKKLIRHRPTNSISLAPFLKYNNSQMQI